MAFIVPTNVATGDVLTAATWNQSVVANFRDGLGLQHLSTTTFTTASTITVDSVFTSRHSHYRLTFDAASSGALDIRAGLRSGGTTNTSAIYDTWDNAAGSRTLAGTYWTWARFGSATTNRYFVDLMNPAAATAKGAYSNGVANIGGNIAPANEFWTGSTSTTVFDGLALTTSTGTVTGTLRIYGLLAG